MLLCHNSTVVVCCSLSLSLSLSFLFSFLLSFLPASPSPFCFFRSLDSFPACSWFTAFYPITMFMSSTNLYGGTSKFNGAGP